MILRVPTVKQRVLCGNCCNDEFTLVEIRGEKDNRLCWFETKCTRCGLRSGLSSKYKIEKTVERTEYLGADDFDRK